MKKEKSKAQLTVMERFRLANKVIRPLMSFLKIGYRSKCQRKRKLRPHNIAVAQVSKEAIIGEYPDMSVDYTKILFCDGYYPGLSSVTLLLSSGQVELRHRLDSSSIGRNEDDIVLWLMFCPILEECISIEGIRNVDKFTMSIPQRFEGYDCYHYLMVCRRDYGLFSKSQYLGKS